MKNSTLTGLRSAVAASGVALLMFVAGCGGSDDAAGDEDQGTTQDAEASDTAAEEGAEDEATEEDPAADEGAEDEGAGAEDEAGDDEGGSDAAAGDVASPGEGFDPCDVITADDVNGVLGSSFEEGSSNELSALTMCTFMDTTTGESVIVQWAPVPGTLDDALSAMASMYTDLGEPEPVTVAGASEAAVVSGEVSGFPASILVGTADGGFLQVVATGQDMSNDQAVQIAEITLAGA